LLDLEEGHALHEVFGFDDQVFFLLLLPPIIWESGYHLRSTFFFGNIGIIVVYAVIGTILNVVIMGE
jgi:NhaP-type Na+/H+ or K+/H+ antiporter